MTAAGAMPDSCTFSGRACPPWLVPHVANRTTKYTDNTKGKEKATVLCPGFSCHSCNSWFTLASLILSKASLAALRTSP
jgi:protoheme ferro-lyase